MKLKNYNIKYYDKRRTCDSKLMVQKICRVVVVLSISTKQTVGVSPISIIESASLVANQGKLVFGLKYFVWSSLLVGKLSRVAYYRRIVNERQFSSRFKNKNLSHKIKNPLNQKSVSTHVSTMVNERTDPLVKTHPLQLSITW